IDRLAANGLRFGTARTTPGFDEKKDSSGLSTGEQVRRDVARWAQQFDVPGLTFVTGALETGKVDPSKLETVQAAARVGLRVDSTQRVWRASLDSLHVDQTADSVEAMIQKLRGARITDIALIN